MSAPVNLVSFREFARLDGCSDKLVRNAVKAGKLSVTADNRIDAALAGTGWRQQNRRAAESADTGADPTPVSALSPADAEVSAGSIQIDDFLANFIAGRMLSRADAERVKENGAAAKNLLAAMQEAGDVIDIAIAEAILFDQAREFRDAWMNWPARVGPMIAAELGVSPDPVVEALNKYVQQQLDDLGDPASAFEEA
ncbi:hypothetical protein ASE70_08045 [Sphingomonas sp. Leaf22]|uniref:hypothetical protein n=1 Tax=Sphingomonas sp. Leaf22 TaxID=1735687 RepID=UPI000700EFF6|nr:hypothetical protein [Sphingomonas sp. Leaf22]KQM76713.1 hypothetical protein ASE70_08045 [Sphingomonas sp. Leaf22]